MSFLFFLLFINAIIAYVLAGDNPSLVHKHFWICMFLIFGLLAFPFFIFAKHDPTKKPPISAWTLRENQLGGHFGRCPKCGASLDPIGPCRYCGYMR